MPRKPKVTVDVENEALTKEQEISPDAKVQEDEPAGNDTPSETSSLNNSNSKILLESENEETSEQELIEDEDNLIKQEHTKEARDKDSEDTVTAEKEVQTGRSRKNENSSVGEVKNRIARRHYTGRQLTLPDDFQQDGKGGINNASEREKRALYDSDKVWSIDEAAPADTEESELRETFIDLVSSYQTGKILEGTITGAGIIGDHVCAFVDYYGYTVIIPSEHLYVGTSVNRKGEKLEISDIRYYIDRRVGSAVSFIVLRVDEAEREAFGSAIKATEERVNRYFIESDSRGNKRIKVGDIVEGQITYVMKMGIGVSIQGIETYIPREEISYLHVSDPILEIDYKGRQKYYVGKKVNLKIKNIIPKEYRIHHVRKNGNRTIENDSVFHLIDIEASIKEAGRNPMKDTIGRLGYRVGDTANGRIMGRGKTGYFVRVNETRDILCDDDIKRLPVGTLVKVKIKTVNTEDYRIFGRITGIIMMPR